MTIADLEQLSDAKDIVGLGAALSDPNVAVRHCAAEALIEVGESARLAMPAIVVLLTDADGYFRMKAAEILSRIGPAASDAVPALIEALSDVNDNVRRWAAFALGEIGPHAKQAMPHLLAIRENGDIKKWAVAMAALKKIEPSAMTKL